MRHLFILLTIIPNFTIAQTFSLNDTIFKTGDILILDPLLFDFNKATIRPESVAFLDSLRDFLNKHDGLFIEIGNHRDNRNPKQYMSSSQNLTMARAQSVAQCLIEKGVNAQRLTAVGYGGTKPIIPDSVIAKLTKVEDIENAHMRNRRTEVKILRIDK